MLAASGLGVEAMPRLVEGSDATGVVRPALAERWGLRRDVVVAGGAGDNAAGAIGVGVIAPGQAFVSLGTSGVYFVANARFAPNPDSAVHAFCHCLPHTWHQMSVILSAASCLSWVARVSGAESEAALLSEVAADPHDSRLVFLPYLSGERTPHNDPHAQGVFFGLTHATTRADLGRAVLEGVALAFVDAQDALRAAGAEIREVSLIGGGARSELWGRILASALDRPLRSHSGEVGPAFGAARLARLAVHHEAAADVCVAPPVQRVFEPDAAFHVRYREHGELYRRLYAQLRDLFPSDE